MLGGVTGGGWANIQVTGNGYSARLKICGIMRITKLTDLASMFISDGKILEELVDCMVSCAVLNRSSMELVVEVDKECKKFEVINEYDTIVIRHAMDLCVIGAAFRCIDSKAKKCR
uniref:Uncharacterized protein n=1 Tax=Parascaris equorum TaxID=6256 RepID=A0A914S6Z7_PAREQ